VHLIYKFPLFCNKVLTHTKKCVIISRIEYPFEAFGMKKPIAEGTLENLILSAEGARLQNVAESLRQKDGADKSIHLCLCVNPELPKNLVAIFIF